MKCCQNLKRGVERLHRLRLLRHPEPPLDRPEADHRDEPTLFRHLLRRRHVARRRRQRRRRRSLVERLEGAGRQVGVDRGAGT